MNRILVRLLRFGAAIALLSAVPPPANAQYIYLDSNGDGIHSFADVLRGTGTNVVDVWLNTNQNADGSQAICDAPGESGTPLTFFSYFYNLRADGGTVIYGVPTNQQPGMPFHFGRAVNETDIQDGWGGASIEPPGLYRLSTLTIVVASGTPSIRIIPYSDLAPWLPTSFGTSCSGLDIDNTYKLGTDFLDADGLTYAPGTSPNAPPLLSPLNDMTVAVGEVARQPLAATDADADNLQFRLVNGPSYAVVSTTDPGSGVAHGQVLLRPTRPHVGSTTVTVGVSDLLLSDEGSFVATVTEGPGHAPRISAPSSIRVEAGAIARELIYAWDADGDAVDFLKVSGPPFVTIESPGSGAGGAYGHIVAAPTACDVGAAFAVLKAADGAIDATTTIAIDVVEPAGVPSSPVAGLDIGPFAFGVAIGDWNSDAKLDGAGVSWSAGTVTAFVGDGSGGLSITGTMPVGLRPQGIVTGDWNLDGRQDLASMAQGVRLAVMLGRGDGTFEALSPQVGASPIEVLATADLDRDGYPDIVCAGSGYQVALGRGDGTFDISPVRALSDRSPGLALGDFDRDGWTDLLVRAKEPNSSIGFMRGNGDGTFAEPAYTPVSAGPYCLRAADMNRDGNLDVIVTESGLGVRVLLGDGAGSFSPGEAVGGFDGPWAADAIDWDGDGLLDIVVSDELLGSITLLRGTGDGRLVTGALGPPAASFGSYGVHAGDFNADGRPDILASTDPGQLVIVLNTRPPRTALAGRTFQRGDHAAVPAAASSRAVTLFIEPIDAAYENTDVDPTSIRLRSEGTGSVAEIAPVTDKSFVVSDVDQNGVMELAVRFAAADVAALFSEIRGRQEVPASLDGWLYSGGRFCSRTTLRIVGVGGNDALTASVSPNPLNPRGVLRVETTRPGPLRVRLYDLQGRLVRTIVDRASVPADRHEFEITGEDAHGRSLATGVYFYRVETGEGVRSGRFTILK